MEQVALYHETIEGLLAWSGISDKLMHVHIGLLLYVGAQIVLRTRRASIDAWLVVLAAELANEILDRLYWGSWRIADTSADFVNTMFWPTALLLTGLYRRRRWAIDARRRADAAELLGTLRAS